MKFILVVGAGQLGSRHLQGLAFAKSQLHITVVDPSENALDLARSRWEEAGGEGSPHRILWCDTLPAKVGKIDLALVLTSSKERALLVKKIVDISTVDYWLLEKVIAQSVADLKTIQSGVDASKGCWVNTSRRMMSWFRLMKNLFGPLAPLRVTYSRPLDGLWGLACNSIHIIDLVSWWSRESLVSISTEGLNKRWFESKRVGYFEVAGELVAEFSKGSRLALSVSHKNKQTVFSVETKDGHVWHIDEDRGTMQGPSAQEILGKLELQSEMTGRLVDGIFLTGISDLPTLSESAQMHAIFIDAVLAHWNQSKSSNDIRVPIT